jgi:CRP/FNR family transcriptional regulator, dissimilatory nitrate respiration regulator
MHVVLAGVINLVRSRREGSFLILQRAGPGSILAEPSLYSETYHCDAVASGAADTRAYAKASFAKLLVKSHELSNVWAGYLAQELRGRDCARRISL